MADGSRPVIVVATEQTAVLRLSWNGWKELAGDQRSEDNAHRQCRCCMHHTTRGGKTPMLYTIAVVLVVLWLLGLVTSTTMGGFIHILLVIAVISILFQVLGGKRT
jgi:hypothetical protein